MTLCLYLNDRTCHRLSHNLMDVNVMGSILLAVKYAEQIGDSLKYI